jgi:hypothetical protein
MVKAPSSPFGTSWPTRILQRVSSWPLVLLVLLFCASSAKPAGQAGSPPVPGGRYHQGPFDGIDDPDPALASKQLKALNTERQRSMVSDTEKLLRLAQELNSEIDSGDRGVEMRKIADIEKLARNVKQKMSVSLVGSPAFHFPPPPTFH